MKTIGFCTLKKQVTKSINYFAPLKEIEGKKLAILECNFQKDCLCLGPEDKYIISIDKEDIEKIEFIKNDDPVLNTITLFYKLLNTLKRRK